MTSHLRNGSKRQDTTNVNQVAKKRHPLNLLVAVSVGTALLESSVNIPTKIETEHTVRPPVSKESESYQKRLHFSHWNIIYAVIQNSQDTEIIEVSADG